MRTHAPGELPTEERITELLRHGTSPADRSPVAQRLRGACYLDEQGHALTAEQRMFAQYRQDGLALLLGAGVSEESGLPGWKGLAERMLAQADISEDYRTMRLAFPSLESQFDFVAHKLGKLRFTRELYHRLYANLRCKRLLESIPGERDAQHGWAGWSEVLAELRQNRTLAAVGDLMILEEDGRFHRNPQVHAVITTNADNLLEIYCRARTRGARRRIVTIVDRASVGDHPEAISVFHLHGTFDARGENFLDTPNFPDDLLPDLVFRESEYYDAIASPAAFVNDTPQSCFQRLNVLFVGTSLGDLNIRRWLYNSWRERVEKRKKYLLELYADRPDFRRYTAAADHEARLESARHFWFRLRSEGPQELIEDSVRNLGVQIIWCDSFGEIQAILQRLRTDGCVRDFGRRTS